MEHGIRRAPYRRRYLPGFLATTLWLVPTMGVLAVGGFFLAQYVLAPKYLKESTVRRERLQPVAILSPEEQARARRETTSHVWTQGVGDDDIPKLAPTEGFDASPRTRSRRSTTSTRTRRAPDASPRPPAETTEPAPDTGATVETPEAPPAETPAPENNSL